MSGLFVVFEGGDGVGKSTQTRLLASWLGERGIEAVCTFEPGDTPAGRRMREILLSHETGELSPRAEALLFAADKAQHVDEVVAPALARDAVVICDRYVDSTLAYQGAGRVLEVADVEQINRWATGDLRPDLTILLDLDATLGLEKRSDKDRMEAAGLEFHERVREGFLALARRDPERYLVLAARDPKDANAAAISVRVARLLGLSDPPDRIYA